MDSQNEFKPKVFFENLVGHERDLQADWTYEQSTCASTEQLQRFWAVDPEAVRVEDYTLFRAFCRQLELLFEFLLPRVTDFLGARQSLFVLRFVRQ